MSTSLSEKPIVFRAEEVHGCPAFELGQQVTLLGRCVVKSATTGICAYLMANIRPLLEAVESGMSAAEIGINLNGGTFRCSEPGCSAVFRVNVIAEVVSEQMAEADAESDSILENFPQPRPSSGVSALSSSSIKQEIFNGTPFLRRLDIALARDLLRGASHKVYKQGKTIIAEGKPVNAFYVIQDGEVEILRNNGEGIPALHARIGPAECFGEFSLFTNQPSNVSVRTASECSIWSLPNDIFQEVMRSNLPLHRNFSRVFAQRIKYTGKRLSEYLTAGITGNLAMLHLAELLQALFLSERTGTLLVSKQDGAKGCIYFEEGKILFAACNGSQGKRAVFAMLGWNNGSFWFQEKQKTLPRNIPGETVTLLMEAEKELNRLAEEAVIF
ncbi:MAG: cyclic nucleotide-binding domain-containing protein [Planctomycetes bacterium]|nr:cyclic nucleotide-binding domain-containing protein [Planctomycetota bacterium]